MHVHNFTIKTIRSCDRNINLYGWLLLSVSGGKNPYLPLISNFGWMILVVVDSDWSELVTSIVSILIYSCVINH